MKNLKLWKNLKTFRSYEKPIYEKPKIEKTYLWKT